MMILKLVRRLILPAFIVVATIPISNAQIAKGGSKFLGNIIGSTTYSDFLTYWNQVTPENAGKWGSVESTRNVYQWYGMDLVNNFAKTNKIPVKFHTLVWGQQQPGWISSLPVDQQKAEVEQWFNLLAARYPNFELIDVVNEPLHAVPSYKDALGGNGTTGWDWVIWSFRKARELWPKAILILNDYHLLNNGTNVQNFITIINLLKKENLIDAIGCQGHFLETTPAYIVRANLFTLAGTGLPIYISEFDLNLISDAEQKAKYEEIFPILWEHPSVKGITLWGYKYGNIWRTEAFLLNSSGTERPAMTWLKQYVASTLVSDPVTESPSGISLYPNPATDYVKITNAANHHLSIYDLSGRQMDSRLLMTGNETIDISAFPSAALIFRLASDAEVKTIKVIRQN